MKIPLPLIALIVAGASWLAMKVLLWFFKAVFVSSVTVHVEKFIPATPTEVWNVLIDIPSYSEWNRVNPNRYGAYEVGKSIITLTFKRYGPPIIKNTTVTSMTPTKEIIQSGGSAGSLSYKHQWLLEPVDGGTLLIHHEVFRGHKVSMWKEKDFKPGYQRFMQSLHDRVIAIKSGDATVKDPTEDRKFEIRSSEYPVLEPE